MKRGFGGMMLAECGGLHKLLVIGGSGSPPSTQLPQAEYIQLPSGRVRTNEQNLYNMSTSKYINVSYYTIRYDYSTQSDDIPTLLFDKLILGGEESRSSTGMHGMWMFVYIVITL